ncbi:MAG: hypothetical protein ACOYK8_07380 [Alphaproteobacteria bacterium]
MLKKCLVWHRKLSLLAGLTFLLWAGSGLVHPILSLMKIQAVAFTPPVQQINMEGVKPPSVLVPAGMAVKRLRYLEFQGKTLLQVTTNEKPAPVYIEARSGEILPNIDKERAEMLARYYAGIKDAPITLMQIQENFDRAYAPINKLLPVWKVEFATKDQRSLYVETNTDRVGTVNTPVKLALLWVFQRIHTLDFLQEWASTRAIFITLLIAAVFSMAMSGIGLLFLLKRPQWPKKQRGWHRALGVLVWLPFLMFSSSGAWHVWVKPTVITPLVDKTLNVSTMVQLPQLEGNVQDLRLLPTSEGVLWRVEMGGKITYRTAEQGTQYPLTDSQAAVLIAAESLRLPTANFTVTGLLTRFSPEYGFANKRLPVWRLERGDNPDIVFVETRTGKVAAMVSPLHKAELWSFTNLHKWQFLNFLGMEKRDMVLMFFTLVSMLAAILGLSLKVRRK